MREIGFVYAAYNEDNELEWYDFWDEEERGENTFPLAIQLTVTWNDDTTERWLRRTAGTSTNTEYLSGTAVSDGSTGTSTNTQQQRTGGSAGGGR